MVHTKVDRKSAQIMEALAKAPLYRKYGEVRARPAVPGEQITTTLQTGAKETDNIAKEGDWIITNPSGEQYILPGETFLSRYESTFDDGVYSSKGYCRAVRNPFGEPVEIQASWGSPQYGDENCMFADVCDEHGTVAGEPYLIEAVSFANTYKEVN